MIIYTGVKNARAARRQSDESDKSNLNGILLGAPSEATQQNRKQIKNKG